MIGTRWAQKTNTDPEQEGLGYAFTLIEQKTMVDMDIFFLFILNKICGL